MIKWNRVNLEQKHPLMPKAIFMREKRRFYNNERVKAVNQLIGLLLLMYKKYNFQISQLDTNPISPLST